MNKGAIRDFAMRARKRLMGETERKIGQLKIDGSGEMEKLEEIGGHYRLEGFGRDGFLDSKAMDARKTLAGLIAQKGLTQVVEEVSYTWFNRFIAIRFMEVNAYLPMSVRVLSSSEEGRREPEALERIYAFYDEFGLDKETVFKLKESHRDEELFRLILLSTCKRLGEIMPEVFEEILDYTELLLPDFLLAPGSILSDLVESIAEEDFTEQVEIIGWFYQYYIEEKKDEVITLNKKKKISKEEIPAATQLFTPDWIVKYMLENTLGKMWQNAHRDDSMKAKWDYYLESREGNPSSQDSGGNLEPMDITIMDPAMGSGHILVYAFDMLYDMYLSRGYSERDIPRLILEKNLYGLDIDDRAAQMAVFSIMMKARSRDRRFFRIRDGLRIRHNLLSIQASTSVDPVSMSMMRYPLSYKGPKVSLEDLKYLVKVFEDGKNLGSIIQVDKKDYAKMVEDMEAVLVNPDLDSFIKMVYKAALPLAKQAELLSSKYDVVVANPPYMSASGMNAELKDYINKNYGDYKSDLFSVFIYRNTLMTKKEGHLGFMSPFVWMFILSYEKLRNFIIGQKTISSLVQLEYSGFDGATVPVCTFTLRNEPLDEKGEFVRLSDFRGADNQPIKVREAVSNPSVSYRYTTSTKDFSKIPGSPIAYWASEGIINAFLSASFVGIIASPKKGLDSADNDRFVRHWFEPLVKTIGFAMNQETAKESNKKWFPINSGGKFRKWYGNFEKVINWENDGAEIKAFSKSYIRAKDFYFSEALSWTKISSSKFGIRYAPQGFIFDSAGQSIFESKGNLYYILGFLCTNIAFEILRMLNPTLNYQVGDISNVPIYFDYSKKEDVESIVKESISLSKVDWDSFETSWDFKTHPFISHRNERNTIADAFNNWSAFAENQFYRLKANEEELNRIFIDIYGLQDELTPDVEERDVTIRKADRERDVKSFISYAVGCMFGRYSLDKEGLAFAGGEFDLGGYQTFSPLKDNVLLLLEEDYGLNDATELFAGFLETVFGRDSLPDNLRFVADSLNPKNHESPKETIRRYFLKDFYKDHCQTYKKRPIYWMADSGRNDGFKALFYLHRYDRNLLARIRTDYLHATQRAYEGQTGLMEQAGSIDSKDRKKLDAYRKKLEEVGTFDKVAGHLANKRIELDLDDGVEVNYEQFMNIEIPQGVGKKPLKMDFLGKRK